MPRAPQTAPGINAEEHQQKPTVKKKKPQRQLRPSGRRRKKDLRISQLILQALSARKQRRGLSLASLREVLLENGYNMEENRAHLSKVVKSLVSNGSLVRAKGGKNATDSFTLSKRQRRQLKEALTETKAKKGASKTKKRKQSVNKEHKKRKTILKS